MLWVILLYIMTPQMEKPEVRKIDGYYYSERECWEVVGATMEKLKPKPGVTTEPRCVPVKGKLL